MQVKTFCKSYFNGFQDVSNYKKNDAKTNVLAVLKIFSYFTVVIPFGFSVAYGTAYLYARVSKKESLSSNDKRVNVQGRKHLKLNEISEDQIIPPCDSKLVHSYTGDLNLLQKSKMKANFIDDNTLKIVFKKARRFNVTIRQQDIFSSNAQVIVNAANTQLRGGGGIDGAIHKKGGHKYKAAHRELQVQYKSKYVSGYASLIKSGSLKADYNIDNVIVVAGPKGETSPEKEDQLYSCYYNSLVLADNHNKTSIAFPSISTGIFGFPKDRAACIFLKAIYDFINKHPNTKLKKISVHFLVSKLKTDLEIYKNSCD